MEAFLAGVLFGFLFAGSIAVAVITHMKRSKRPDPEVWSEEAYHQHQPNTPKVVTKVSIHERTIQL
jgi:hypothetical protein